MRVGERSCTFKAQSSKLKAQKKLQNPSSNFQQRLRPYRIEIGANEALSGVQESILPFG
jgi:hypothetical protein